MHKLVVRLGSSGVELLNIVTPDIIEFSLLEKMVLEYYKESPKVLIKREGSLTIVLKGDY